MVQLVGLEVGIALHGTHAGEDSSGIPTQQLLTVDVLDEQYSEKNVGKTQQTKQVEWTGVIATKRWSRR